MKTNWLRRLFSILKYSVYSLGFIFLFLLIIAFTRIPFDVHRWLGLHDSEYLFTPEYIVFLGGSGMPSESNLIRLYYTSQLAGQFPAAKIIIAHPIDTVVISLMRNELITHGVDSARIVIEKLGTNTREQALEITSIDKSIQQKPVLIVTSPENMYRTIKVFRKAGFLKTGGEPAFENAMFVDLSYNHRRIGGKRYIPDVSGQMGLRYTFWNYFKLEIICLREFAAILYYKLNGWI
jgi:uncharacterized SAM-binding protein YcdF (DUF218 family)